jgi:hypothetical protein
MKLRLILAVLISVLFIGGIEHVKAQTGQVVYISATAGTTLAGNCPTTPTVPVMCFTGAGIYAWQSSTTGWFLLAPAAASSGVTSVNGQTGAVTISATASAPVITVTPGTVSGTTTLTQLGTPSVSAAAPTITLTVQ